MWSSSVRRLSSAELGSDVWSVFTSSSALLHPEERLHGGEKKKLLFQLFFCKSDAADFIATTKSSLYGASNGQNGFKVKSTVEYITNNTILIRLK